MAGQQLGGTVDHHVRPEIERPLQQGGGEGVVDHHVHPELMGTADERLQISDSQQHESDLRQRIKPICRGVSEHGLRTA